MSKHKRVNPNRQPVTQADVNRQRMDWLRLSMCMSLWCMKEIGLSSRTLDRHNKKYAELCDSLSSGRITYDDIVSSLENDFGIKVNFKEK